MQINIHDFLATCGLTEKLYPGKRHVQKLPRPGEYRSHCVEYDWRDPATLRLEIKAGLSGRSLPPKDLKKYPVSFQARTYIEFSMNRDDEAETEETSEGSGDGGGHALIAKPTRARMHAFRDLVQGAVPDLARVKSLVLMGKSIAQAAMPVVLDALAAQIRALSVAPVNLLAAVTKVTHVAPGGYGHVTPAQGQVAYHPHDWAAAPG